MLTTTGQLKVLDFGLARIETPETATQLTAAGSTVGTAAYMSPEQAAGETVDARSDLWSLGVVTYEMLAGRPPFNGTSALAIIHAVLTTTPARVRTATARRSPGVGSHRLTERSFGTASGAQSRPPRCAILPLRVTHDCHLDNRPLSRGPVSRRRRWIAATVLACRRCCGRRRLAHGAEREDPVGPAPGAAGNHQARRCRSVRRLRTASRSRRSRTSRRIHSSPEQMRAISRRATHCHGSAWCGGVLIVRTAVSGEPWRRAGQDATDRRARAAAACCTAKPRWRAARWPKMSVLAVRARRHAFTSRSIAARPGAAWHGPHRSVRPDVRGCSFPVLNTCPTFALPDYWIDRHEVTNRAFKQFVDEGGYRRPELWREHLKDGRRIDGSSAAMAQFRDATGRPGPATWEMGAYIPGTGRPSRRRRELVRSGRICALGRESRCPPLYHWSRAADPYLSADIVPLSNFSGRPVLRVGAAAGITHGGTTSTWPVT